jgi:hypothetical protein
MIHESDLVALRRKSNVADRSIALVENLADGIFQTAVTTDIIHHRQIALCVPIRPADVGLQFFRRSSSQGRARQHAAHSFQLSVVNAMQNNGQFILARDRQQVSVA